jgi:hypothetical protein
MFDPILHQARNTKRDFLKMSRASYFCLLILLCPLANAFLASSPRMQKRALKVAIKNEKKSDSAGNETEDEVYFTPDNSNNRYTVGNVDKESTVASEANYLDDLTPPPINLKRDSILFSENPSTKRNDGILDVWISCKTKLPAVLTGAWLWRPTQVADENPIGALYNMVFVRIPVIGVTIVYIQNLIQGHPLVMDIGQGQFEVSPFIVLSVLALILA